MTLTGAGGSGKTRLALRVADECAAQYGDGAWFVGLADVTDPGLIPAMICQALAIDEHPSLTGAERLLQSLRDRELLLVLDNLEQLATGTAVLGELLAACPTVTLLVSSREPLHLAAERQYDVPVLAHEEAIELFVARAHAVMPSREIDRELAGEICERVDCLPLAIELAAARTKAFGPTELLARLERRLPTLTGGPRDAPRRQRTLTATLEWSYKLLDYAEQRLFARLAVFAGGFALQAAEAVCGATLDSVQSLIDRSLIRADGARYAMLQTIREYALERLEQRDNADATRAGHAHWLVELLDAEQVAAERWSEVRGLDRLRPERENFRAALQWASNSGLTELVAHLASSLSGVWLQEGQPQEAGRWMLPALARQDSYPPRLAAQVVTAGRAIARQRGDYARADQLAKRALTLWQGIGDAEGIGRAMVDVGSTTRFAGDLIGGRATLEQAITFARDNALNGPLTFGLNNLAELALREGRLTEARALCDETLAVAAPASIPAGIAFIHLAYIHMLEGRCSQALCLARQALDEAIQRGALLGVAWGAIALAWPLAAQNQFELSGRLLGAALGFLESAGLGRDWTENACDDAIRVILRRHLGTERTEDLLNDSRAIPLEQAARDALAHLAPPSVSPERPTPPTGSRPTNVLCRDPIADR